MDWQQVAEYANRSFQIAASAQVKVEQPVLFASLTDRQLALRAIEHDIATFCTDLGERIAEVQRLIEHRSKPRQASDQLPPWAPHRSGTRAPFEIRTTPIHLSEHPIGISSNLVAEYFSELVSFVRDVRPIIPEAA